MPQSVPAVLASWVALGLVLFWRRPGRDAALAVLIGGWVLLPVARFPAWAFADPVGQGGPFHALAVPTAMLANKATAVGLACLAGIMLFDGPAVRRLRPSRLDLPMAAWCLVPMASALANGLPAAEGLAQCRYLALAWGVPYLVGRVYLGDDEGLRRFALALIVAGLVTTAPCLLEFLAGPWLYGWVYGPHPYQMEGAARPVLFRPLLFWEHGNQLGMWTAVAAVAGAWLWRSGRLRSGVGIPGGPAAAGLVAVCLLCQSHSSVALLLAVLAGLLLAGRRPRPSYAGVVVAALLLAASAAPVGAAEGGLRGRVRDAFRGAGKGSFNWRLARSGEHLARVAERPVLGWGRADWSAAPGGEFVNPVNLGLWLLAAGMYGAVGLAASTLVLTLPVVEVLKWLPPRSWLNPGCSAVALAAVLLAVNAVDSLLNSVYLLPVLAGAGGINTWSQRRYDGA